ncbi:TetR family transcriptional regulator C-terminal domain-containing protein [Kribbella sp. NPDC056951]|uniref:TetR/AcrR family transcriptional regulator n=1 Tax=Kribbella sp. NPDC056951 TaxID=3345978 RepID=UPI003635961B
MARRSMREEILESGVELFLERGFNAAAVKDITDRAGVPKGSFYNHFESKEALAAVALERYGETRPVPLLRDESLAPVVRIRRHFESLGAELSEYTKGCMYGNFAAEVVDHSEPLRLRVKGGLDYWSSALAETIAAGQAAGEIRAGLDPERTARYLTSAWEGAILRARADKSGEAFDIFFDLTFSSLLA